MSLKRKTVTMIVVVSAPLKMAHRDVLAEVRNALVNSDPIKLTRHRVGPVPKDRIVKGRQPRVRRTYPLLEAMGVK